MSIQVNRKALADYFIEERFEAGLVLEGWEVKAIRTNGTQLRQGYVLLQRGAFYLVGVHITPLPTASTHIKPDPLRDRKLLLKASEIRKLIGSVERQGYTLVPLDMHYKNGRVKCTIGLARGKQKSDKREVEKKRDWNREKQRLFKKVRNT